MSSIGPVMVSAVDTDPFPFDLAPSCPLGNLLGGVDVTGIHCGGDIEV